jgi:hypothetical protein
MLASAPSDVEVLVVDNASTDRTRSVVDQFRAALPIRYFFEPTSGVSRARNHALRVARGTWILWTDDDVDVGLGWLDAYRLAIDQFPEAVLFGGAVYPRLAIQPSLRIMRFLSLYPQMFALIDPGPGAVKVAMSRTPHGANMMVRAAALGGMTFDVRLGVSGQRRLLGEETILLESLLARPGGTGYWVAGAGVHHRLPAERLTTAFVRRWAIGAGHSRVIMGRPADLAHRLPARLWVHQVRQALRNLLLGGLGSAFTLGDRRIRSQIRWWSSRGQLAQLWYQALRKSDG